MKALYRYSFALPLIFFAANLCSAQSTTVGCELMQQGVFTTGESTNLAKIVIKGNRQMEFHHEGKEHVNSQIEWLNDCEYQLTIMHSTLKSMPFQVGDIVHMKIDKVEDQKLFYTARVIGGTENWQGIMTKQEGQ